MTIRRIPVLFLLLLAAGCSDDNGTEPTPGGTTEAQLYSLGKNPAGFTFYKNSSDTITKGGNSAHPDPQLRTRYNAVAAKFLDANGKVKSGTLFPDSSLIVKELYTNSVLTTYVFMFKRAGDPHADANGWVWAETHADGSTLYAASKKGAGCVGCHGAGIDNTRMNDAHP